MTSDTQVRHALMQAVGSQSVAVSIIDNNPGDPVRVVAEVRAALVRGLDGNPPVRLQMCPRGVHRDWWADGENLGCPWCRIAVLEGAAAGVRRAS